MAGVDPETKEKALQWLYDNDVMTVVEKAINEACRQTPSDVNGFMADFFKGSSHPASVAKVEATSSFNAVTGQPQLRCTLYAETCATHRPVSTCIAPTFLYQMQVVSQDDGSNKKQSKPVGNHTPLELVDCEVCVFLMIRCCNWPKGRMLVLCTFDAAVYSVSHI
eukprot:TRINITY_DN10707_c0_g1_i1.p2 TRINITY_DN10707_c0_g1~~TRINITY_DN10707_c0_g1_i1.p2  ORF type:complete len:165 (+),score=19.67 TRINITY_DN10707_c0_g1_i1:95-589(+)